MPTPTAPDPTYTLAQLDSLLSEHVNTKFAEECELAIGTPVEFVATEALVGLRRHLRAVACRHFGYSESNFPINTPDLSVPLTYTVPAEQAGAASASAPFDDSWVKVPVQVLKRMFAEIQGARQVCEFVATQLATQLRAADVAAGSDRCVGCGCTDNVGCYPVCSWVEPGLCTTCATTLDLAAQAAGLTDRHDFAEAKTHA